VEDLLTALALVLVIEGALYALFPNAMRRAMARLIETPETPVRLAGVLAALIGAVAVFLIRG
jgi:hypothetical protein